ncbi:transketolase [Micromonospora sp. WMMD1076]|uniref:transketolase n=1 Tax=Micromonospora sp. WMMD1076 TaxID=3016103 RepID=UPI00249C6F31|nr:transketolase [Micromonospora sp. WMMD1076]WFF05893.1 transketolase [Micromonospora sp. WMMD1076]
MMDVVSPPRADTAAGRVRRRIVQMCGQARGGHLGGSMSLVEILLTLYQDVMRVDPARPDDPDRDIMVLSKGHGAIGLYAVLTECGFLPESTIAGYGRPGGTLLAHPVPDVAGVEAPTGALGHGLPLGVGYALAMRLDGAERRCFVVLGDGELQEGSVWEAAMAAAAHRLDRLVAVVDRNGLQITGPTEEVLALEPLAAKWASFGWTVRAVDGHDRDRLCAALSAPPQPGRPTVVLATTVKGKGLPYVEDQVHSHYARLGERQLTRAMAALDHGTRAARP